MFTPYVLTQLYHLYFQLHVMQGEVAEKLELLQQLESENATLRAKARVLETAATCSEDILHSLEGLNLHDSAGNSSPERQHPSGQLSNGASACHPPSAQASRYITHSQLAQEGAIPLAAGGQAFDPQAFMQQPDQQQQQPQQMSRQQSDPFQYDDVDLPDALYDLEALCDMSSSPFKDDSIAALAAFMETEFPAPANFPAAEPTPPQNQSAALNGNSNDTAAAATLAGRGTSGGLEPNIWGVDTKLQTLWTQNDAGGLTQATRQLMHVDTVKSSVASVDMPAQIATHNTRSDQDSSSGSHVQHAPVNAKLPPEEKSHAAGSGGTAVPNNWKEVGAMYTAFVDSIRPKVMALDAQQVAGMCGVQLCSCCSLGRARLCMALLATATAGKQLGSCAVEFKLKARFAMLGYHCHPWQSVCML